MSDKDMFYFESHALKIKPYKELTCLGQSHI